jgi:hypothetical protein
MENPGPNLMGIVSSITSTHFQRITIGFRQTITNAQLESAIESKSWGAFDEAITRLAERALENGRMLQFELHVCGNPSTELFNSVFPGFVESGCLKVVKALRTSGTVRSSTLFRCQIEITRLDSLYFGSQHAWLAQWPGDALIRAVEDNNQGSRFFGTTVESMAVAIYHPSRQYINHHLIHFSRLPKHDRTP